MVLDRGHPNNTTLIFVVAAFKIPNIYFNFEIIANGAEVFGTNLQNSNKKFQSSFGDLFKYSPRPFCNYDIIFFTRLKNSSTTQIVAFNLKLDVTFLSRTNLNYPTLPSSSPELVRRLQLFHRSLISEANLVQQLPLTLVPLTFSLFIHAQIERVSGTTFQMSMLLLKIDPSHYRRAFPESTTRVSVGVSEVKNVLDCR